MSVKCIAYSSYYLHIRNWWEEFPWEEIMTSTCMFRRVKHTSKHIHLKQKMSNWPGSCLLRSMKCTHNLLLMEITFENGHPPNGHHLVHKCKHFKLLIRHKKIFSSSCVHHLPELHAASSVPKVEIQEHCSHCNPLLLMVVQPTCERAQHCRPFWISTPCCGCGPWDGWSRSAWSLRLSSQLDPECGGWRCSPHWNCGCCSWSVQFRSCSTAVNHKNVRHSLTNSLSTSIWTMKIIAALNSSRLSDLAHNVCTLFQSTMTLFIKWLLWV